MSGKSSGRLASFIHAFHGIKQLFRSEPNARIHLLLMIATVAAGFYFQISRFEWLVLILCFGIVFITELINTSLEFLCDHVTPERNEQIKRVKDLAAGAVLMSAITVLIAGLIIFVPYIYQE